MVRRALKGLPFTFPDNHHIHHRLLRRESSIPGWSSSCGARPWAVGVLALVLHFMEGTHKPLVVNVFAVALLVLTLRHLANLEIAESLRTVRNINRRKLTPRGKVLALRRDLELMARRATADSLLKPCRKVADKLGLDSLKVKMAPRSRRDEAVPVFSWDRRRRREERPQDWKAARPRLAASSATAGTRSSPASS